MDSLSLSDLWNKHREYTYAADQGWGGGYGSAKGGKAAAEAIYKFVATKYDKKTAEDMQDASDNYLGYQEYVGGAEAKSAKADEERLRKKYGIKEETESSEESLEEAYKPLRKPEVLVAELQSIIDAPDAKLWDVTSVSIRLSHDDIFDRFPKIYPYVKDMWAAIMTPDGARKTKEIAKKAIEAVHKYYPVKEEVELEERDLSTLRQRLDKHSEAAIAANREGDDEKVKYHQTQMNKIKERMANMVRNEEAETLDEAINWLGDYLPTSEKSKFGGYLPMIINKKTKGLMYQSAAKYKTPDEAKDHAEDFLKQKSKGIKDPKVPLVGTYKEETEEEVTEAVDPATKRRKQLDMARVNAGAMSRDDYDKKYKLGKYRPAGSKPSGPGGLYKNLVKEVLDPEDDASVWIDDFVKSDDPRFEGKSKEARIKMALGAWYAAQKKESVEQSAESLEEATMTAAEKKIAQEVHDALKDGEQVSQAYGMQIRAQHNKLTSKFGKDWRKIAGIKEESAEELEEAVNSTTKRALNATLDLDPNDLEVFLNEFAKYLKKEANNSREKDWKYVADHIEKAYKTWKSRKLKESTETQTENLEERAESLEESEMIEVETQEELVKIIKKDPLLKKWIGKRDVYFDNTDLVVGDKTAMSNPIWDDGTVDMSELRKKVQKNITSYDQILQDAKPKSGETKVGSFNVILPKELKGTFGGPNIPLENPRAIVRTTTDKGNAIKKLLHSSREGVTVRVMARKDDQAAVYIDAKDAQGFSAALKKLASDKALNEMTTLEEVVALPSVKKVIDMVDEMSPKEYSNFLHALADNAFGIAVSTKRVKPNGPSNSDAWEDVADGIRDAAKAYDARPVKMSEGAEELEEAAIYPLTKKALNATFELDSDEFEEFLKELTMYFNKTGDKTGYNEYFQVGEHLEKAYKIWKGRDPDAGLDYGI
jgi:flavin-binding protein dodecin/translation elongation factor EF-1beta